jgi:hypothetical protein
MQSLPPPPPPSRIEQTEQIEQKQVTYANKWTIVAVGSLIWTTILVIIVYTIVLSGKQQSLSDAINTITKTTPTPTKDESYYLKLPSKHQKLLIDKYLELHPQLYALELSTQDYVEPLKHDIHDSSKDIRQKAIECMEIYKVSALPVFESYMGDSWWQAKRNRCDINSKNYYYSIRREQNIAKLLYCLGRNTDLKVFMSPVIGYGSAALQVAAGISNANVPDRFLVGYEVIPRRFNALAEPLRKLGAKVFQSNVDFSECRKNPVTVMFVDVSSYTQKYIRSSLGSLRDNCQPQIFVVFNVPDDRYDKVYSTLFHDWEIVIQGVSSGAGCYPANFIPLRWGVFRKTNGVFRQDVFIQAPE